MPKRDYVRPRFGRVNLLRITLPFWRDEMAKPASLKIRLVSTADTGYYYVTKKNPRTMTEKMIKTKYDPVVRKHVKFKESKIK